MYDFVGFEGSLLAPLSNLMFELGVEGVPESPSRIWASGEGELWLCCLVPPKFNFILPVTGVFTPDGFIDATFGESFCFFSGTTFSTILPLDGAAARARGRF